MPFWRRDSKSGPSSSSTEDASASSSSAPPPFNDGDADIPMTTRWYITFDCPVPPYIIQLCEAIDVSWTIVKNSPEGSSGAADAAKNKFRERFMILFPQDIDTLPDLMDVEPPPLYTDEKAEVLRRVTTRRYIFDTVSEDLQFLKKRNGLGELMSALFLMRSQKSIVQVRCARQDKSMEDYTKIRGVEVQLRTIQFKGVEDIEAKLEGLSKRGVIWAKYGLWCKKALTLDDNIKAGQWIVFATWPDDLRLNAKKDGVMDDWKEPYHLGRGSGRYSVPMGSGSMGTI